MFALDELKLQPNGGRGLTLMDLDAKDALVSVAAFTQSLRVLGSGARRQAAGRDAQGRGAERLRRQAGAQGQARSRRLMQTALRA